MSFNKILPFHFHKANSGKVKWMFKDLLQIRFWSLSFWLMSATKHWIHQQKKKRKHLVNSNYSGEFLLEVVIIVIRNCSGLVLPKIPFSNTFGKCSITLKCKCTLWILGKGYSFRVFQKQILSGASYHNKEQTLRYYSTRN